MPTSTDLVTDLPADFAIFGQAVDTSMADLKGGTTGQVLSKTSNTDMDFTWVAQDDSNAIQNAIVDAKGDLITATAADTPARLAVGTNGQTLVADSSTATGLKWATASGGGKVLQVVTDTTSTEESTTSSSYIDTALSLSITPSAATSKVLVILSATGSSQRLNDQNARANFNIMRTTNQLAETVFGLDIEDTVIGLVDKINLRSGQNIIYLDSPSTTSATTYKTQMRATSGYGTAYLSPGNSFSSLTLIEIGA
jgi:hypothetical protein